MMRRWHPSLMHGARSAESATRNSGSVLGRLCVSLVAEVELLYIGNINESAEMPHAVMLLAKGHEPCLGSDSCVSRYSFWQVVALAPVCTVVRHPCSSDLSSFGVCLCQSRAMAHNLTGGFGS